MPSIDEIEDFMEDLRAGQKELVQRGHEQKLLDSVFKAMQDIGIKPRIKKDGTLDRRAFISPRNGMKGGRPARQTKATIQASTQHRKHSTTTSYNTILSPSENLNTSFEDPYFLKCCSIFEKTFGISYEKTTDRNRKYIDLVFEKCRQHIDLSKPQPFRYVWTALKHAQMEHKITGLPDPLPVPSSLLSWKKQ